VMYQHLANNNGLILVVRDGRYYPFVGIRVTRTNRYLNLYYLSAPKTHPHISSHLNRHPYVVHSKHCLMSYEVASEELSSPDASEPFGPFGSGINNFDGKRLRPISTETVKELDAGRFLYLCDERMHSEGGIALAGVFLPLTPNNLSRTDEQLLHTHFPPSQGRCCRCRAICDYADILVVFRLENCPMDPNCLTFPSPHIRINQTLGPGEELIVKVCPKSVQDQVVRKVRKT